MDLSELLAIFGPGVSGAVFGTGWWFWVDAVVCSSVKVPFVHYLPGIFASLAALMFNCVRKEDIDYSPYEEGEWRLKLWLFIAYVVSFVSLAASVGLLIQDALVESGPSAWTGVAGVLQCVFVLIRIAWHVQQFLLVPVITCAATVCCVFLILLVQDGNCLRLFINVNKLKKKNQYWLGFYMKALSSGRSSFTKVHLCNDGCPQKCKFQDMNQVKVPSIAFDRQLYDYG
ncbi:UNVERIFIED_CONTAM: hypothetical protein Sradi_3700000 [Sesamum radiatum]|uniref:Transmembrane protein 50 homolog n=1 Tax=Sesamum radiatum TaxID=300843 RepID=A0AAW2PXC4_SESRA